MTTLTPSRLSGRLDPFFRDPLRAFRAEMDNLMHRFFGEREGAAPVVEYRPRLDLSETDEALHVRVDLPGVKAKDIDIEVTGNTIRITGERKEARERKGRNWHYAERPIGTFSRSITLPCPIQEDKVGAEDQDGILTITLPKAEAAKTRHIAVTSV